MGNIGIWEERGIDEARRDFVGKRATGEEKGARDKTEFLVNRE